MAMPQYNIYGCNQSLEEREYIDSRFRTNMHFRIAKIYSRDHNHQSYRSDVLNYNIREFNYTLMIIEW